MQQLIDTLSEVLEIDLNSIRGEEIVGSNLEDIQEMVELLYEYSNIFREANKKLPAVQSEKEGKNAERL